MQKQTPLTPQIDAGELVIQITKRRNEMNREQIRQLLPVLTAFANGEVIEHKTGSEWSTGETFAFCDPPDRYRVKPKPKYRPFANVKEFLPHKDKFVIVKGSIDTSAAEYYRINVANDTMVWFYGGSQDAIRWERLFREYVFEDGTPCGVLES